MGMTAKTILVVLLVPLCSAQGPSGFPASDPIEELGIVAAQSDTIELAPGAETSLSYVLTNLGNETLALTLLGGSRAGFGQTGAGGFDGSRPPPNGTSNGTRSPPPARMDPPPDGERPPGAPNGGRVPGGAGFPRSVNATLLGEPNITLDPGSSATVTYSVQVAAGAQAGESPVTLLLREREGNRTATYTTTVRVIPPADTVDASSSTGTPVDPTSEGVSETPGLGAVATTVALFAAVLLMRRKR